MKPMLTNALEALKGRALGSYPVLILLSLLALLSAYIRIIIPWSKIFTSSGVVLGGNDAYYHTRLVENTIANFPTRAWFDPMTFFPHGSSLYWGPIHDQLVATLALIVGLGSPSTQTIYAVNALFPALLGVLLIVPAYLIGKKIHGRKAGLLSALLVATIPGQLLNRTMLGFADHHAAEILLSTLMILFLLYALESARGITFEQMRGLLSQESRAEAWQRMRLSVLFLAAASLSYTFYQLSWTGALMLAFVMLLFIAVYSVIEHMRGNNIEHVALLSVGVFLLPFLAVLPISDLAITNYLYYSQVHVLALAFALLSGVVLALLSVQLKQRNLPAYSFPLIIVAVVALLLGALSLASPDIGRTLGSILTLLTKPTIGELSIAEATPIFFPAATGGKFTLAMVNGNFGIAFYLSLVGMALLLYQYIKAKGTGELLVLVWSIVMFWAMYQQNRFAYYYAVNVAVLTGYVLALVLDRAGLGKLSAAYDALMRGASTGSEFVRNIKGWHVFMVVIVVLLLVWPWGTLLPALATAERAGGPPQGWQDALVWLDESTPQPGVDYYTIYEKEGFEYPEGAYGVLSWWDYGHWILAIGHRMPNANPFQQGIGGGPNKLAGASTFFTALNESYANSIADELGTRYVLTDIEMATGKFYAMTAWALDTSGWSELKQFGILGNTVGLPVNSEKFTASMTSRLHFDDARTLSHYRLVYESPGYIVSYQLVDMNKGALVRGQRGFSTYNEASYFYSQIYPFYVDSTAGVAAFDPKPPASYVKVFEYVEGAQIKGSAPDGTQLTLSVDVVAPNRAFRYSQQTTAQNGSYSFTVPYSTLGSTPESTLYDIGPISPYRLSYANTTLEIDVSEDDVLNGRTVYVR
ncbi:MAG: oligosaccharyl transferase, archaeosortase A system-associated [Methermicoccaceae archaeon]